MGRVQKEEKKLRAELENEKNQKVSMQKMIETLQKENVKPVQVPKEKVCPNCHAPIDDEMIFCGECGTKL